MKISNENINKLVIDTAKPNALKNLKELKPIYNNAKSFYKKAYTGTITNYYWNKGDYEDILYLKSYNTIVACIWQNQLRIYGYFSQTTARHIREFAKQNGFDDNITKQDMMNTCVISK